MEVELWEASKKDRIDGWSSGRNCRLFRGREGRAEDGIVRRFGARPSGEERWGSAFGVLWWFLLEETNLAGVLHDEEKRGSAFSVLQMISSEAMNLAGVVRGFRGL